MKESILLPVIISLKVAIAASGIVLVLGVILAWIFTKYNFRGKSF